MPSETELGAGGSVDGRGMVLAVTAVLAAVATLLVTPGSGAGPAAVAVMAWFTMLGAASWATFVDDGASTWHRVGAVIFAVTLGTGFIAAIESAWALVIPAVGLAGALGRRQSEPRFVAAAAWAAVVVYIVVAAEWR